MSSSPDSTTTDSTSTASTLPSFPPGVHTVAVTPFKDEKKLEVDYEAFEKYLVEVVLPSPVAGLVLPGTTSEAPALSTDEKLQLVQTAYRVLGGKKFLTVGVGGSCTQDCVQMALATKEYADGFMVTVPAYNKPMPKGILNHFLEVAGYEGRYVLNGQDESYLELQKYPMMIYNIPSRTGVNMTTETLGQIISGCPNIRAVKEASGNTVQVLEVCALTRKIPGFRVFSGDDLALLPSMANGAQGVISVASNLYPEVVHELYTRCQENRWDEARELCDVMLPMYQALFCETNPGPVKTVMGWKKMYPTTLFRSPMMPMDEENAEFLEETMRNTEYDLKKLGLFGEKKVEEVTPAPEVIVRSS